MTSSGSSAKTMRLDAEHLPFDLRDSEELVAMYIPKFRLYLQKALLIAICTSVGFGLIPGLELTLVERTALALVLVIAWTFSFEEWRDWYDRRGDLWVLTNQRLVLSNPDAEPSTAWLDLADIVQVRIWMWWGLRVTAQDGRVSTLSYIGPVKQVKADIEAAQEVLNVA